MEACRIVRRWASHIFLENWLADGGEVSFMSCPPFNPGRFLICSGDPKALLWLEELGHLITPLTSGTKPMTFLNQLCYRMTQLFSIIISDNFLWLFPYTIASKSFNINTKKKTPWSESASELYRPSNRRLSAKWLPTFADGGCHVVSVTDPYGRILGFLDRSRYFSIK
jgi:hypothetical protein